jgi:predicted O-methyltransferase YrrM
LAFFDFLTEPGFKTRIITSTVMAGRALGRAQIAPRGAVLLCVTVGVLGLLGATHALHFSASRFARASRLAPPGVRRRSATAPARVALRASTAEQTDPAVAGHLDQEAVFMEKTKVEEELEKTRLLELKATNMTAFTWELRKYVDQINATGPPPLAPDNELRDIVLRSSTPQARLLDDIHNYTFRNVPYEDAMYICAPEQATMLTLLARVMRARECLDIGSFTGYSAAAVMSALPASGRLTAIDNRADYAAIAQRFLSTLPPALEMRVGDALAELGALEAAGRQFDMITIDADKLQQQAYYEASLRLLRPRGLLVMFGMMLYPSEEDKEAIDSLISLVANDTRVTTTMLPIGCGVQICTKQGVRLLDGPLCPPADLPAPDLRRYELNVELAALDVALADARRNRESGGRFVPLEPPEAVGVAPAAEVAAAQAEAAAVEVAAAAQAAAPTPVVAAAAEAASAEAAGAEAAASAAHSDSEAATSDAGAGAGGDASADASAAGAESSSVDVSAQS